MLAGLRAPCCNLQNTADTRVLASTSPWEERPAGRDKPRRLQGPKGTFCLKVFVKRHECSRNGTGICLI